MCRALLFALCFIEALPALGQDALQSGADSATQSSALVTDLDHSGGNGFEFWIRLVDHTQPTLIFENGLMLSLDTW